MFVIRGATWNWTTRSAGITDISGSSEKLFPVDFFQVTSKINFSSAKPYYCAAEYVGKH
jgi:hypothetical protein